MSLNQKDLELIERIIWKSSDDIAVSISRALERLEERIDAGESRLYGRFADLEDSLDAVRQAISDQVGQALAEHRQPSEPKERPEPEPF